MKVLVTGANGYIGAKVVKQLCDFGIDVVATDFDNSHIDTRANFIAANIFEGNKWFDYFGKPDVCLHLAWRDGFVHNSEKHMTDLSNHFKFIKSLIDDGLKSFATMGSMHEVGYWEGPITENTPCSPLSQYGIAKNALRKSIELYARQKGCHFLWLRAYYIFGDDSYGNSIFCKIRKAVEEGEKTFPFTTGRNQYDFIHIDQLALQISKCVIQNKITGIINCCSGKPVSLADQIEWYISFNKLPISLDYGKFPDRPYDSPCVYGDNKKIRMIENNFDKAQKRVLVTGFNGQLGFDCFNELKNRGYLNIKGTDKDNLDITDEKRVHDYIKEFKPDVIIHCAAWTAVDKAEDNKELVYKVNALGTKYIAEAANEVNASVLYVSTDYVFDGKGDAPFEVDTPKGAISTYGKTKSDGEDFVIKVNPKHFIVRTTGVFGINGNNFINTMLKLADMGKTEINVVNDQIVSVTYTKDLAVLLIDMIETEKYGVYHAANGGYFSWCDFSREIFAEAGKIVRVNGVTTEQYKALVPGQTNRPKNSRLSMKSLDDAGFNRLPDHLDALRRYLKEIGE